MTAVVAANRRTLLLGAAASVAALALGLVPAPGPRLEASYDFLGFYGEWALLALALVAGMRALRAKGKGAVKGYLATRRGPLALWAVLVVLGVATSVYRFRMLSDETNILGVSASMYLEHLPRNLVEGLRDPDTYKIVNAQVDKRSNFFPFLIYLAHGLTGFRAANAFAVSMIAAALGLLFLYELGSCLAGRRAALYAMALAAATPLYFATGACAGMEAVSNALLLLLLLQLARFMIQPSARAAELLVVAGALAAQGRYESPLLLLLVGAALWLKRSTLLAERLPRLPCLAPFALVPILWQRRLTVVSNAGDAHEKNFDLPNIPSHVRDFVELFVRPDAYSYRPTVPLITAAAALAAVWLLIRLVRGRLPRDRAQLLVLYGLGFAMLFAVHMSFNLGDLREPAAWRMALVYVAPMALVAAVALAHATRLGRLGGPLGRAAVLTTLAALLTSSFQYQATRDGANALLLVRETERGLAFVAGHDPRRTLVIAERPGSYASQLYGAVGFTYANAHASELLARLRDGTLHSIVVFQRYDEKSQKLEPRLDARLQTEPRVVYKNETGARIYISEATPAFAQVRR